MGIFNKKQKKAGNQVAEPSRGLTAAEVKALAAADAVLGAEEARLQAEARAAEARTAEMKREAITQISAEVRRLVQGYGLGVETTVVGVGALHGVVHVYADVRLYDEADNTVLELYASYACDRHFADPVTVAYEGATVHSRVDMARALKAHLTTA